MPRPRADKAARRAEFASVAARVFAERGVANTTVSDIVKAAGVSQGTFYIYFDSKDEVILAVVQQMTDEMLTAIQQMVDSSEGTAVEKLLGFSKILTGFSDHPGMTELAGYIHDPDNRALHERLTEHLSQWMVDLLESIITQGVAEGVFDVPDARAAAWFVGGGWQSVELAGTPAQDMPAALDAATQLVLRALGYKEEQ